MSEPPNKIVKYDFSGAEGVTFIQGNVLIAATPSNVAMITRALTGGGQQDEPTTSQAAAVQQAAEPAKVDNNDSGQQEDSTESGQKETESSTEVTGEEDMREDVRQLKKSVGVLTDTVHDLAVVVQNHIRSKLVHGEELYENQQPLHTSRSRSVSVPVSGEEAAVKADDPEMVEGSTATAKSPDSVANADGEKQAAKDDEAEVIVAGDETAKKDDDDDDEEETKDKPDGQHLIGGR